MDIACCKGSIHDFTLFKQSIGTRISGKYYLFADSGYQGIIKFHKNSTIPKKKPRNGQLSEEDKEFNRLLSKYRIYIEHVNNRLKTFKILSTTYRNRRKRYNLRINLIAGIYNYECVNK